jgi:signal transduction histidine kinase
VTVADTGAGIPAERREGLFERPQRGNSSLSGGLGLLIVHRMLLLNGSDIHLVERVGRGAVFEFELPAAMATSEVGRRPGGIH